MAFRGGGIHSVMLGDGQMQVDILLKIAGVGLMVSVICQVLSKAGREDMATLAAMAGIILVLLMVVSLAGDLLAQVQSIFLLP